MSIPTCRACSKAVETWQEWFGGDCPVQPHTGHDLPWEEIKTLPGWDFSKKARLEITPQGNFHMVKEET